MVPFPLLFSLSLLMIIFDVVRLSLFASFLLDQREKNGSSCGA